MIAEWLCNPASRNLGLKNLSWVRLDHKMTEIEELIGSGKNQIDMSAVSIDKAAAYAADDAFIVFRLMDMLEKELKQNHAAELMKKIEMPLITTLADMEMAGVALDTGYLAIMSEELTIRLRELEQSIYREVGEEFNLNSTQQLSVALFDKLKLPPPDRTRKTASGHFLLR
jgi:DNA polymerase-1